MKRFSYRQRDDAFGQSMLALRTSLGLTQGELAHRLGVSERAVRQWEAGESYPKAEHLQHVMTLAVQASAFPPGREAEEIRALWKAARQKVLLDEQWLSTLLGRSRPSLELVAPRPSASVPAQPAVAPGPWAGRTTAATGCCRCRRATRRRGSASPASSSHTRCGLRRRPSRRPWSARARGGSGGGSR